MSKLNQTDLLEVEKAIYLRDQIEVNQSYARSVNIEYDLFDENILGNYLLTAQVIQSISRIINGLQNNNSKAWTLTGPYGSGKSYFSLFLTKLLSSEISGHQDALDLLFMADSIFKEQVENIIQDGKGFFPITINGYRASLEECVVSGIQKAIQNSKNSHLINFLKQINANGDLKNEPNNEQRVLSLIDQITAQVQNPKNGYKGILFIFDEMGKALEQASFHNQENDVYLLQEIAEYTNHNGNLFIGVLHQSFERYASLLDNSTQREWAKVQGRFEDIPFQEPPIQHIRLLGRTLSHIDLGDFERVIKSTAEMAVQDGWNPNLMAPEEFVQIAAQVYPFHPSTLVVLPYFFRRLAQNERSIFAFLSSQEPFGFQDFISKNPPQSYFRLPDLFDYLLTNYQGRIFSSGRARTLSEASDRLENVIGLTDLEIKLIKTIGLLNWMSEITHINATETLIIDSLIDESISIEQVKSTLDNLQKRSVIVFRRFNKSFYIWQGSDVNLEEKIQEGFGKLTGSISLAKSLEKYLPPRPIVARKHSFETGTLRFFEVRYIDSTNIHQVEITPNDGASGILFLCLPNTISEIDEFIIWAKSDLIRPLANIVVCVTKNAIHMGELILELSVLNWVKEETSKLRDDPVARKELRARVGIVENSISSELEDSLDIQKISNINAGLFFHFGEEIEIDTKSLIQILSEIMDSNYNHSPIIWNEIINRNKLSTQGAMARKIIIHSILSDSHLEHFGYEGFPPQRSIYENIMASSGIHRQEKDVWVLHPPFENEMKLLPVWQRLEGIIFDQSIEQITVQNLFDQLHAEPFGLSYGVAPILLCAFLKINKGETTLYQQGALLPDPSPANWDLLLSRPDLFSVAGFRIVGARKKLIDRFAKGFGVEPELMPVVRILVKGVSSLPEHTKITKRLSNQTLTVRGIIQQASSPEKLLFVDIPGAMHLAEIHTETSDQEIELFFSQINVVNKELTGEMDRLLTWGRDELLKACGIETTENGWGIFRMIASKLAGNTNRAEMKPLYMRASESSDPSAALESALAFIANRPPRNWTDLDTDRYLTRVSEMGEIFKRDQRQFVFETMLTPQQREASTELAELIRTQFIEKGIVDPDVIKGALNILNQKFFLGSNNK